MIGALAAIGAIVVIIIVVVIVAASSANKPGSGTSSHPAAKDISISTCAVEAGTGIAQATGTILNHSSGKSNYTFTVSFLNSSGTVVAQGAGLENDIGSGQSATFTVTGDRQVSGSLTCKVADVSRFAAP